MIASTEYEVRLWQRPLDQWTPDGVWVKLPSPFASFESAEEALHEHLGHEFPRGMIIRVEVHRQVVSSAGWTDGSDAGIIDAIEKGILPL